MIYTERFFATHNSSNIGFFPTFHYRPGLGFTTVGMDTTEDYIVRNRMFFKNYNNREIYNIVSKVYSGLNTTVELDHDYVRDSVFEGIKPPPPPPQPPYWAILVNCNNSVTSEGVVTCSPTLAITEVDGSGSNGPSKLPTLTLGAWNEETGDFESVSVATTGTVSNITNSIGGQHDSLAGAQAEYDSRTPAEWQCIARAMCGCSTGTPDGNMYYVVENSFYNCPDGVCQSPGWQIETNIDLDPCAHGSSQYRKNVLAGPYYTLGDAQTWLCANEPGWYNPDLGDSKTLSSYTPGHDPVKDAIREVAGINCSCPYWFMGIGLVTSCASGSGIPTFSGFYNASVSVGMDCQWNDGQCTGGSAAIIAQFENSCELTKAIAVAPSPGVMNGGQFNDAYEVGYQATGYYYNNGWY